MLEVMIFGLCTLISLYLLSRSSRSQSSRLPSPPGPKGLPLIGNLFQFPQTNAWEFLGTEALQKYGDIVHFFGLGKHIVILNSYSAAYDLLVRKAAIYSDRPSWPMIGDVMYADHATGFVHYGPEWRAQRRLWKQHLGPHAMGDYVTLVHKEVQAFVMRLLSNDKDIHAQIKLLVVKIVVGTSFGKTIQSMDDEFVEFAETITSEMVDAMMPGKYLVDTFPLMIYIPAWFPGASWKRFGLEVGARFSRMVSEPYEYVKSSMAAGIAPKSFVSDMIQHPHASEITQRSVSASVYAAAIDTTHEVLNRFIVAMMSHPDVQSRAQQEVDSMTGQWRLPGIQDKGSLPYVDAVVQEVLRLNMILPLSVPHATIQDDEYKDFHIPKGSTILFNSWAISQNPKQYPDPEKFDPERYLKDDEQDKPMDPRLYCFGVGRRICPGRYLAEMTLYHTVVTMLATVDILKPLDKDGNEYMPKIEFDGVGLSGMRPFEARIVSRLAEAKGLLSVDAT